MLDLLPRLLMMVLPFFALEDLADVSISISIGSEREMVSTLYSKIPRRNFSTVAFQENRLTVVRLRLAG